ncbi:MAG: hypothetical protein NTZ33_01340 [Bacteroidetes bacterium]|nr:hypothetical protein [Bacteroidota bacterium]
MENIAKIFNKLKTIFSVQSVIGAVIGMMGGFIYYLKVGCATGACPIKSNPWLMLLWGGLIGGLIGDIFTKKTKTKT